MYLLFKAVKAQLEKGPIDVITGEARYSLSEQKLIRQQLEVESLNATVEGQDGTRHPVKLLDCDSISQAKEKMMDVVYRVSFGGGNQLSPSVCCQASSHPSSVEMNISLSSLSLPLPPPSPSFCLLSSL